MQIRKLGMAALLVGILVVAFIIRIQGVPNIPEGQFTETDAYFYYWQAQLISEQGQLPERDMNRWLPLGRDLSQTLNLYPYVLAYVHKIVGWVFPNISLYHIAFYAPPICFCIGLTSLYFFLFLTFGLSYASIVGVLLVTLPGTIARSTAGFSDRDTWCLMLGILVVTTYLVALQTQQSHSRIIWTLASGFIAFFGGLSWEGFGVFLLVIICVEWCGFLSTQKDESIGFYCLWVCTFVPTLYFVSPAYRSGDGFATHIFALTLAPPLFLLGMRVTRHILITRTRWAKTLKPHSRPLALGLTLTGGLLALGYILLQHNTFANTTVPFSENKLMQTIEELAPPLFEFWVFRYGSVFLCACIGMIMVCIRLWKQDGTILAIPLILFCLTTFFRQPLDRFWGTSFGDLLFGIAFAGCLLGLLFIALKRNTFSHNKIIYIAFTAWFLLWSALSRDAKRYDFFIGVPLAFFTADLIRILGHDISQVFRHQKWRPPIKIGITVLTLSLILFWTPAGGHAKRSYFTAEHLCKAVPGNNKLTEAIYWMKASLPRNAVVAANWSYGSMLNTLAGVKTIVDQDHYIQHWIHLYNQYIYNNSAEQQALEFLKSHNATHLMYLRGMGAPEIFLNKPLSDAFHPTYPTDNFAEARIKIWELHYPPNIQSHQKYIATEPEE